MSKRSGFLSLLFILNDKNMKKMISALFDMTSMNQNNIGECVYSVSIEEGLNDYMFNFPDLIFIQSKFSNASGYDLLKVLMRKEPKSYIIMIETDNTPENIEKAISSGAKGIIVPPFSFNSFSMHVQNYFKEHFKDGAVGYDDSGATTGTS